MNIQYLYFPFSMPLYCLENVNGPKASGTHDNNNRFYLRVTERRQTNDRQFVYFSLEGFRLQTKYQKTGVPSRFSWSSSL